MDGHSWLDDLGMADVDPVTGEVVRVEGVAAAAPTETCLPCRISKVGWGLPRERGRSRRCRPQVRCDKNVPCGRCVRRKMDCVAQTVRERARARAASEPGVAPPQRGKRRRRRSKAAACHGLIEAAVASRAGGAGFAPAIWPPGADSAAAAAAVARFGGGGGP